MKPPGAQMTPCDKCGKVMRKDSLATHMREACHGSGSEGASPGAQRMPCGKCGKVMRKDSLARHMREACRGSKTS